MSGLPREAPCGAPDQLNFCPVNTSQILQGLKSQRLLHPPWTRPSYRLINYWPLLLVNRNDRLFIIVLKIPMPTSIVAISVNLVIIIPLRKKHDHKS